MPDETKDSPTSDMTESTSTPETGQPSEGAAAEPPAGDATDETRQSDRSPGVFGWVMSALICIGLLAGAGGVVWWIYSTEPEAQRETATRQTAMLVDVARARRGDFRPVIQAMGTVRSARDVMLSPEIDGRVVERAPTFTPGAVVREGQVLYRLDRSDYEIALQQMQSELRSAEAALQQENGQQMLARREYEMMGMELDDDKRSLVLREPQLATAKAAVERARAAVERAKLDLKRTAVSAPFDALVMSREATVGSQVSAGDVLGHLVGVDHYWVEAAIPLSKLRWLELPDANGDGVEVVISSPTSWGPDETRTGVVHSLVGEVDGDTRMARLLLRVDDPLALGDGGDERPRMVIGSYVRIDIPTRTLSGVVRLSRDYVRSGDTVWLMRDGELDIREVDVVFRDALYAYVAAGITDGDRVVTTNLSTVVQGAPLRVDADGAGRAADETEADSGDAGADMGSDT